MSFNLKAWLEWIATRPPSVQKAAGEFPIWVALLSEGRTFFVIGYREADGQDAANLLITEISPFEDWHAANETKQMVHIDCARALTKLPLHQKYSGIMFTD